uniref:transmembrane protein 53-B n=1 Tax=Erigeron canadensis TaxID=72917 RepID=UPI001CB983DE|nr:transmembrane protein 53-B [Erigeron canadensis]
MEASSIITKSLIKPHFLTTILLPKHPPFHFSQNPSHFPINHHPITLSLSNPNPGFPNFKPRFFLSSSIQPNFTSSSIPTNRFARILSGNNEKLFEWKFPFDVENDGELGFFDKENRPVVTVVVLGWLGSQQKHLKRYAEMYSLLGMNVITFPTSVNDVLGFDLGRRMEKRVEDLSDEIVKWMENKDGDDGRERFLIFHTFSNTGWLAYGAILNQLQGREEILKKIKGCVVDSGGAAGLDPKVWSAGFTTAMLKKQSSAVYASSETGELQNGATIVSTDKPSCTEVLLLTVFEKFFTYLLQYPDIKLKLINVISTLSVNQPPHPQLYLYSTADKVIPFQKIEAFAEEQKKQGRKVTTFNFKSTPHVDHYRTFPHTYRSVIQNFLKDCFAANDKHVYNLVQ